MSRWLGLVAILLAAVAVVHPLSKMVARWSAAADLLTHFQEPAPLAIIVAGRHALGTTHDLEITCGVRFGYNLWHPMAPDAATSPEFIARYLIYVRMNIRNAQNRIGRTVRGQSQPEAGISSLFPRKTGRLPRATGRNSWAFVHG